MAARAEFTRPQLAWCARPGPPIRRDVAPPTRAKAIECPAGEALKPGAQLLAGAWSRLGWSPNGSSTDRDELGGGVDTVQWSGVGRGAADEVAEQKHVACHRDGLDEKAGA